jgi:hypothetical protein
MCQKELLEQIASADSFLLTQIVHAVLARYRTLFPEEDVVFLSFPENDRDARISLLRHVADLIELHE